MAGSARNTSNDPFPEQRLDTLFRATEVFRTGRDGASALQLAIFLLTASRAPVTIREIRGTLKAPATSISTALAMLGEGNDIRSRGGKSFGLIALEHHPEDRREKVASLTAKGRHLVLSMRDALGN